MKTLKNIIGTSILGAILLGNITAQADDLQTLKNLERERSNMIETLLDSKLAVDQRRTRIENKVRRLVDLERMVMRDSRLEGNTHNLVVRAFKNYDLTFLAHASVENDQEVVGHWMHEIGLSNEAILASNRGIR